jgi:hypothetical protein
LQVAFEAAAAGHGALILLAGSSATVVPHTWHCISLLACLAG